MLPEIILFPATSIGHAHVFLHSHLSLQALNTKCKVKFIKLKRDMARSFHSHWLVGASTSVLREDFVSSYHHGDSLVGAEPFSGRIMLPTKLQALKLHFFLKDEAGRKNSTVTPGEITGYVAEVIKHYWVLAGYETVASPKNKIAKLLKDYQFQHKNRNKKHKKGLEDRSKFEEDLNKLLDIAHPNLEKILSEDRT